MTDAPACKAEVTVARKDRHVILTIQCADDYAAMLLYDEITGNFAGGLSIELDNVEEEAG